MKIGIVTFHYAINYGAVYQVYALSKALKNLGHDVFVVNHIPVIRKPKSKNILEKIIGAMNPQKWIDRYSRFKSEEYRRSFIEVFESFREVYLGLEKKGRTHEELKRNCPEADAYICGSDQIWNTKYPSFSSVYLLDFVPNGVRRISYAASLGNQAIDPVYRDVFINELKTFSAISVREKSGCLSLKGLLNVDITHVLDPTLLTDDYSELLDSSIVPKGEYIFVYRLESKSRVTNWMTSEIKQFAKEKNLPVYTVSPSSIYQNREVGEKLKPTPGQMLSLIQKSKYFITNSFHGTVFGIKFRKSMVVCSRDIFIDKQNVRMTELLTDLNLSERYLLFNNRINIDEVDKKVDWDEVAGMLNKKRRESELFIETSLS